MKPCPECGKLVDERALFCFYCSADLSSTFLGNEYEEEDDLYEDWDE